MLLIKTKIKPSEIDGVGLFADEFVPKGAVVWESSLPNLDINLTEQQFQNLTENEKEYFLHYGYHDKKTGHYFLTFDNTRFINHASDENITLDIQLDKLVAKRNIQAGEEITHNYSESEESEFK